MRRLLVTGGAGFIGANFTHHWLRRHPEDRLVVLDALTYAGNLSSLASAQVAPGFRFVHGDIRDQRLVDELLGSERIDTIVHFAAESHVDRSIIDPDLPVSVNIGGTHTLLKAARCAWLTGRGADHRFHHVSTDEVFGSLGPDDPASSETARYAPNSPYAASKAGADHLVRAYHKTYGLRTTISNCSNNYGPFQYPDKLIPRCISNLLEGRRLPIYGDGSNVRDWLYVEDHCRGIECILDHGRAGESYNLGGASEKANLDLVRTLCGLVDRSFAEDPKLPRRFPDAPPSRGGRCEDLISFVMDRPGHDRRYAIDAGRARDRLGFAPEVDLVEGLARTVRWYLDNRDWWQAIAGRS